MTRESDLRPGSHAFRFTLVFVSLLLTALSARAQFQSAFVFATDPKGIAVYSRNDATGVLTPVAGSPFPSRVPPQTLTLDFSGRFLFAGSYGGPVADVGKISMFTIDPNTGALQEVPNSPFASTATNEPVFLSAESTGQFLYVANFNSSVSNESTVESFLIDTVNLDLVPSSGTALQLPGLFLNGATHPSGKTFYVLVSNPNGLFPNQSTFLLFNSANGQSTTISQYSNQSIEGLTGCCFALDPQGKNFAIQLGPSLSNNVQPLQSDGTLVYGPTDVVGGASMSFDALGRFLYGDIGQAGTDLVHFWPLPNPTGSQEAPDSPLPAGFPPPKTWHVNPNAPLIYADQVYRVDPQTGVPASILPVSPLPQTNFPVSAVFTNPPGSQPVVGPVPLLSPNSVSFGSLAPGQTSGAQTIIISSIGGQALSVNTIAIAGPNASDFSIAGNTCGSPAVLQPGSSCTVLVSFTPSAAGPRSAALTITDNGSPTTESASLSGTGLPPSPAVTLIPGSLNFQTVTQGTSTSLSLSVTNAGTAALHITRVALAGPNTGDYSSSSPSCSSPLAVNASCTIAVAFTPLAAGVRSATVTLTDDAPDSPQVIDLTGNANPAFTPGPAPNGSTSASVSAGQSALYQLQLAPGSGFTGTVSLSCSGVPLGAVCQVPSTISFANGATMAFTATVTTSGPALVPPSTPPRLRLIPLAPLLPFLAVALLLMLVSSAGTLPYALPPRGRCRFALCGGGVFFVVIFCLLLSVSGCGGGNANVTPPPVVTPRGTSTITINFSANSSAGQPLQLFPLQLSLKVN